MTSRIAYSAPPAPGPYDGKRLSPWRVLLGILVLAALVAGAIFGYRFFVTDQVRAVESAPWFAPYVDVTVTPTFAFESPADAAAQDVVLSFVWRGDRTWAEALRAGQVRVQGPEGARRALPGWFTLSVFAAVPRPPAPVPA